MRKFSILGLVSGLALLASSSAIASTLTQNSTWTLDRGGTTVTTKNRIVAYGDSIYAGYNTSLFNVGRYAAPNMAAERQATWWNSDFEIYRRTKSGARADAIYNEKIVDERSYMQSTTPPKMIIMFEMCGNDYLQARTAYTSNCALSGLNSALSTCTTYMGAAMDYIKANDSSKAVAWDISNLFYPGYDADNVTTCGSNRRNTFLPYIAKSNWRACDLARQKGFSCTDSFAHFMGRDYDSNGDGQADNVALQYVSGESEATYVTRITSTLKSTLRDANYKMVSSTTSYDYIQSDDTHPTYWGTSTCSYGIIPGGTCSGTYAQAASPPSNQQGHSRMGYQTYLKLP